MVNWGPLEICFIFDLNEDMARWFKVFKKVAIREIVKIRDEMRGYIPIKAGFIGYRTNIDFQPYIDFELTNNLLQLESGINSIKTFGPHQCNSMRDAYELANNLQWSNYAGGVVIHISNSPPYSVKYHDRTIHDIYPSIKPIGIPVEWIVERLCFKGINLIIFQMHDCMNIVVDIIQKTFENTKRAHDNEIVIFNKIRTEEHFENELIQQIRKSLFKLVNGN
jgi:hypothetical protein